MKLDCYFQLLAFMLFFAGCSGEPPSNIQDQQPAQVKPSSSTKSTGQPGAEAENNVPDETNADAGGEAPEADQDERYRQLVVGTWEDDYQGHRTMTLCEDGTGTMIVELSGMQATLFARRLEFNMEWSVENGRLKKRTIDGQPARRVNMILKMMGDRVDEPILELTDERLLLLDKDGETRYDWRRTDPPNE
jgi:hypothetical protein